MNHHFGKLKLWSCRLVAQKLEPKSPDLRRLKRRKNLKLKTSNPQSLRCWKFKSKMLLLPSKSFVWSSYAIQFEKTENTHFRFPFPPLSSIFHGYFGRQSCRERWLLTWNNPKIYINLVNDHIYVIVNGKTS